MEKNLLDVQKESAALKQVLEEQKRSLHQMQQQLLTADRERQAAAAAHERRIEDLMKQAPRTPPPAPGGPPRPAAAPTTALRAMPQAPPVVANAMPASQALPPEASARIRILRSDKAPSFTVQPPSPTRADTPFLPAGSYAEGRVVTGAFASSRQGGALPILFAVTRSFDGPLQVRGPGLKPRATALPIEGCLILGKAQADLGSGRVLVQLDTLSCVFPDEATFERPIKGYATGADGTLGLVGRLESRDSAYLAKTFLTSLMSGAAEAFALAKRTVIVTPFGGTTTTVTGNVGEMAGFSALANAAASLSQFYLSQAEKLMPVLWVEAGAASRLVLQEGLALDGLPTSTILSTGGRPE
jgi:conjugal transfer pilus assembly protein TraB